MMDKENNLQFELFSAAGKGEVKRKNSSASFLRNLWNYEKTILIIIGLVTTSIISFSLGVEKGKKLTLASAPESSAVEASERVNIKQQNVPNLADTSEKQNTKEEQGQNEYLQGFTIQLASYNTKTYAEREAQRLKQKGLTPLILSKGKYIVLCVGNFSNRSQAQSLLPQMKKRYADCHIRRL